MNIEILDTPIQFHLHGLSAPVPNQDFAGVGMRLMGELWKSLKQSEAATAGVNHWVYLTDGRMFAGVELSPDATLPNSLEPLEFELRRYLKHLHIGPYQNLPAKWQALKVELASRGESINAPSLEIYGHHGDDPTKLETTILIGLQGG